MNRIVLYLVTTGMVAATVSSSAIAASSRLDGLAPDVSATAEVPASSQAVCDKFYGTMEQKERNSEAGHKDATVAAIEQIKVILKERDAAVVGPSASAGTAKLEEAEARIDAVIPEADRSWYTLIRKHRYDGDHKYAPVCATASQ